MNRENWKKKKPLLFVLIPVGIGLLVWVVMLLWNAILPDVVGVSEITYWQALGILVLSKILFGGFKGDSSKRFKNKKKSKDQFMNMTDEQKATFKSEWESRCGKD